MSTLMENLMLYTKPIGSFLLNCGIYSFYWGALSGTFMLTTADPLTIQEKYSLPPSLRVLSHVICAYDAAGQVVYTAISSGLIGLTWPISIPLIRYWYKKPNDSK